MEHSAPTSRVPFRKDITRSLIDHHVRLAIRDRTIRGRILNVGGGTRTYESDIRGIDGNRLLVTDWPGSPTRNAVDVFCDAHSLPFADGGFDSILCTEVLEHLAEPRRAMKEIHRVLQPDGSLLLTTPFQYQAHQRPFDFFRFTYDALELLAREAGFSDVIVLRRGESLAVALNALRVWGRQRKLPGADRVLDWAERMYVSRYGQKSLAVPLSRDPMALGYTVIAHKGASSRAPTVSALH